MKNQRTFRFLFFPIFLFLFSFLFLLFLFSSSGYCEIYYVDALYGNDENIGNSTELPWKTLNRVNLSYYKPGDSIFFQGSQIFNGTLTIRDSSGTVSAPILVSSYGNGRATILSDNQDGILLKNVNHVRLVQLNLQGAALECPGGGFNGPRGIFVYKDKDVDMQDIEIEQVDTTGYCVGISAYADSPGLLTNLRIKSASSHHNWSSGIALKGSDAEGVSEYPLQDIYIGYSHVHDNHGVLPNAKGINMSGSGIFVYQAEGATIEYNTVHDNGGYNACSDPNLKGSGSFAIWAYGNEITMQYNEAYGQKFSESCPFDSGGFNINGSNSRIQYNYSHDNAGPAFLLDHLPGQSNNMIRYNISENDGRKKQNRGLLTVTGGNGGYEIYNNTIFASAARGSHGAAVFVGSNSGLGQDYPTGILFRNNIFISDNEGPMITVADPEYMHNVRFEQNNFYNPAGRYEIKWGANQFNSLEEWTRHLDGAVAKKIGPHFSQNPGLCDPGHGGAIRPYPLTDLKVYRLKSDSPMINVGWDLKALNVKTEDHDFFDVPVPQQGTPDLGASEFSPGQSCL